MNRQRLWKAVLYALLIIVGIVLMLWIATVISVKLFGTGDYASTIFFAPVLFAALVFAVYMAMGWDE